jgi:hypothetical protein
MVYRIHLGSNNFIPDIIQRQEPLDTYIQERYVLHTYKKGSFFLSFFLAKKSVR